MHVAWGIPQRMSYCASLVAACAIAVRIFRGRVFPVAAVLLLGACSFHSPERGGARIPGDGSLGNVLAFEVYQYIGAPYLLGGASPKGFDCSGLMYYVYKRHGITIPRTAQEQSRFGRAVGKNPLKPGDLLFFSRKGKQINHVGMFVGDDTFVHALNPEWGVLTTRLSTLVAERAGKKLNLRWKFFHARRIVS
jgi:hypothetical protein